MSLRRRRLWLGLLLIAVVLPLAVYAMRGMRSDRGLGEVPTSEVERGTFERRVTAEGNLEAAEATLLGPPPTIRGAVNIAWLASDGSPVHRGDVVIRFDPTDLEKKLREGQSDRATADSRIQQKRIREDGVVRNLERDAEVAVLELDHSQEFQQLDPQIFSHQEIVESQIDATLAEHRRQHADQVRGIREELAGVELDLLAIERRKAELQVSEAEQELDQLEVRAPHDGIFVLKEVWGDVPEVGSTIWGGMPVAEIPRLERMDAKVYVLEADAGGLELSLPATIVLDAHPGRTYQGTVKKVDALAKRRNRNSPVQYFTVVLELERTEPEVMKPGQRIQADLVLERVDDVLTVPRQAVFDEGGESVVYVRRGGRFEPSPVKLGSTGLGRVVIESGITDGDVVALRDPTRPLAEPDAEGADSEVSPVAQRNGT